MKVVIVGAEFKEDVAHLELLAEEVDLILYGHQDRLRGQSAPAASPPTFCRTRTLRPVAVTPWGPLVWYYPALRQALEEDQPDVVHVVAEPWRPIAVETAAWMRRRRTTFVVSSADRNWRAVPLYEQAVRLLMARLTLARVDGFASESSAGVDEAVRFGLPKRVATAVIHGNPRNPAIFRPPTGPNERAHARRNLGLPVEGVGVGFLGRLRAEKGPELFVDAIGGVAENGVWAALAGSGPLEPVVRAAVREPSFNYLGEISFPEKVAELYRALDIVVVPSVRVGRWEEQAPRAAIEAMLSGCTIVATKVGGIPEMLGDTGVLVDPNPSAVRDGIRAALAHDGSAGRRRALEQYSSEAVAARLIDFWKRSGH